MTSQPQEFPKIVPSILVGLVLFILLTVFFGGPGQKALAWLVGLGTIVLAGWWLKKWIELSDLKRQAEETKEERTDDYRTKWVRMHKNEILRSQWRTREEWRKNSTGLRGLFHRTFLGQEVMEYLREPLTRLEKAEQLRLESNEGSGARAEGGLVPERVHFNVPVAESDLIRLILEENDQALISTYGEADPEAIRDQFMHQRGGKSRKATEKMELAIKYIRLLIEYGQMKNHYDTAEIEKKVNTATKLATLLELEAKMNKHVLDMTKTRKALEMLKKEESNKREDFDYSL